MKKTLLIIFVSLLLIISGLLLVRYINYQQDPDPYKSFFLPRVALSVVEITSLAAEKTEMNVSVLIKNTLPFNFTADSFQYQLYINDAEIMKSRYKKTISLNANDSSWVKLPVTVFVSDADSLIDANEKRKIDSAEYRMHASFYSDLLFNKTFNVTIRRFLPLVHIPDIDIKKIEIDSLNTKRAIVHVHAAVKNANVFDIKFRNYAYELQIEDHQKIKGRSDRPTVIKAKGTTVIDVPAVISFKGAGNTLFKLLKKGADIKTHLVMNVTIESDNDMLKNSTAIVRSNATVKSILKTAKGDPDIKKDKGKDKYDG
jgi:LEA14-like dessication related protein